MGPSETYELYTPQGIKLTAQVQEDGRLHLAGPFGVIIRMENDKARIFFQEILLDLVLRDPNKT